MILLLASLSLKSNLVDLPFGSHDSAMYTKPLETRQYLSEGAQGKTQFKNEMSLPCCILR